MRGYASSYNIISILTHRMNSDTHKRITALGLLVTIGIVFGDIGTSPLYVMRAVIGATPNFDADYIIGAVSCVIWTLTLQTTLKYVIIALRADNNGEGGILSLFALLRKMPRRWLYIVAAAGAAALIADGVITPAITVTSAIEGLNVVFGNNVPTLPIVLVIIALLFAAQQLGTGRIGRFFGPFMLAWFVMLAVLGICRLPMAWQILSAFNPYYAIHLLWTSPEWFVIVGHISLYHRSRSSILRPGTLRPPQHHHNMVLCQSLAYTQLHGPRSMVDSPKREWKRLRQPFLRHHALLDGSPWNCHGNRCRRHCQSSSHLGRLYNVLRSRQPQLLAIATH